MAGKFSLEAIIKAADRFSRPIAKMQSRLGRFAASAKVSLSGANAMADKLGGALKKVGLAAVAAGAVAGAGMANVVTTGMEFEQTLINAAAKFPGEVKKGTEAFQKLEETAKRIGSETEFTSAAAAEGLNFLAMAGFNAEQSVAALPGVVDLATAAQIELGQASDVATDSLGAFNLMTNDAAQLGQNLARVNDVIAKTTTTANTDVEQLFEAMKNGGPVATSAGASLETFAAMAGELANAGIKGSAAGNTLKNMFARLAAPPSEAAKALKKLKIETLDSSGNLRDITAIIGELNEKTRGMGTGVKSGILTDIFGLRAVAGATVLLNSGQKKLESYRATLEGAAGASKKMAGTMRDSTLNDFKSFESAVEGVKIAIFDVVKGPLREIVQSMIAWTRANKEVIATGVTDFIAWLRDNLPAIVKWGKRIGIIVGIFTAVAAAVKVAMGIVAAFNAVAAMNPYVLIALAIVAAIALIVAFWPEISGFFSDLWDHVKRIASDIADFFVGIWNSVVAFFTPIFEAVKSVVVGVFEFIVGLAKMYFGFLKMIWTPIIAVFAVIWEAVKAVFSAVWDGIVAAATAYFGWLHKIWSPVIDVFLVIWGAVKNAFVAAWDAVVAYAKVIFEKVKRVWAPIKDFFSSLWDGIAETFQKIVGTIVDKVTSVVDAIRAIGRGDDPPTPTPVEPSVVPPQERSAKSMAEELAGTPTGGGGEWFGELNVNAPPGTATVGKQPKRGRINLQPSGAF